MGFTISPSNGHEGGGQMINWLKKLLEPVPLEAVCSRCESDLTVTLDWGDKVGYYIRVEPCKSCTREAFDLGYEQCKEEL